MRRAVLALVTGACLGCTQYANVYVNSVAVERGGGSGGAVALAAYSARSGEYLDLTPFTMKLKKAWPAKETLSLLVRNECRIVGWQVVAVEHWAFSALEASEPSKKNEVRFEVKRDELKCP